jgi:hypothetical protein
MFLTWKNGTRLYFRVTARGRRYFATKEIDATGPKLLAESVKDDEAHFPTQQTPPEAQARVSRPHENARRAVHIEGPAQQGPDPAVGLEEATKPCRASTGSVIHAISTGLNRPV